MENFIEKGEIILIAIAVLFVISYIFNKDFWTARKIWTLAILGGAATYVFISPVMAAYFVLFTVMFAVNTTDKLG